jgi:valyl-tRNA synthetase
LASLQKLTQEVSDAFEAFQFNTALEAIRNFTWHALADDYLEAVKHRLQPGREMSDLKATQYCLREALLTVCKLLAPICPHISEAVYHQFAAGATKSIHKESWPTPEKSLDDASIRNGRLLLDLIAQARREKSSKGVSLGENIRRIVVGTEAAHLHILKENEETILRTLKADTMDLERLPSNSNRPKEPSAGFKVEIIV